MAYSYIVLGNLSRLTYLVGTISPILLVVVIIMYNYDDNDEIASLPTSHLKKVMLILVYIIVACLVSSVFLPSPEELKILYNIQ